MKKIIMKLFWPLKRIFHFIYDCLCLICASPAAIKMGYQLLIGGICTLIPKGVILLPWIKLDKLAHYHVLNAIIDYSSYLGATSFVIGLMIIILYFKLQNPILGFQFIDVKGKALNDKIYLRGNCITVSDRDKIPDYSSNDEIEKSLTGPSAYRYKTRHSIDVIDYDFDVV